MYLYLCVYIGVCVCIIHSGAKQLSLSLQLLFICSPSAFSFSSGALDPPFDLFCDGFEAEGVPKCVVDGFAPFLDSGIKTKQRAVSGSAESAR